MCFQEPLKKDYASVWTSQVALVVKNPPPNARVMRDVGSIPGREDPLEKEVGTLPEQGPGGLQFIESHRVGHD